MDLGLSTLGQGLSTSPVLDLVSAFPLDRAGQVFASFTASCCCQRSVLTDQSCRIGRVSGRRRKIESRYSRG